MNQHFNGWAVAATKMLEIANAPNSELNDGQRASLRTIATRLPHNGVIIADEVGMGKTRIAVAVARAVVNAGGRVAILVPPGLGFQWGDELRKGEVDAPPILRSLDAYLNAFADEQTTKWGCHSVVVLSHVFCNWSLGSRTAKHWRWSLLPAVLAELTKRSRESGRVRIGRKNIEKINDRVKAAAQSIVEISSEKFHESLISDNQINIWGNNSPLFDPANYTKDTKFRAGLECVVGIGLGTFDLVIIDEAHKNRGAESNLNRLLSEVVLPSSNHTRRLAMTATPVELDSAQWSQILGRIQVDEQTKSRASTQIADYAQAVAKVRQCPNDSKARETYAQSAVTFKQVLKPYLLRRDKREDPAVIKFQAASGEPHHTYRRESKIVVDTAELSSAWKHAVCAAEALSFVTRQSDQTAAKRLRLTLANGHGIAALIDQLQPDDEGDKKQREADHAQKSSAPDSTETETLAEKRLLRAEWWQNVMTKQLPKDGSALFNHPAILAAIKDIEQICQQGEKVLVFGRFTRPMRALVQLLNAREMLRCIDEERPWPQSKIHEHDEWLAVTAAHQQLNRSGELNRNHLDQILENQYKEITNKHRIVQDNLIRFIKTGFDVEQPNLRERALFNAFEKDALEWSETNIVARAIQELLPDDTKNAKSTDFSRAFIDLLAAASDRDEGDANGDGELDTNEASELWSELLNRLKQEYDRPQGGFARLMHGETKPDTRRFLQLAFNREHSHPKVLVAQSLVGREGLNLHKACRTVVLLHPEWNPGVVEQQIGRVDRIGSLWEQKLHQAIELKPGGDLPRIEVCPVVFKGTYDEENWKVLQGRWADLRAQLHGIVISESESNDDPDQRELIAEINGAAPNFSPCKP